MSIERIMSAAAPAPGGSYFHATRRGDLIMTSGQVGIDPASGEVPASVIEQTEVALANIASILAESGATLNDVVKTTCYLSDLSMFGEFDIAYRRVFGEELPARSTVGVQLPPAYSVEIEAVAIRPGGE